MGRTHALVLSGLLLGGLASAASAAPAEVTVHEDAWSDEVQRFGINLGGVQRWGTGVVYDNLVANPGFEPPIHSTTLILSGGEADRAFVEHGASDVAWPDGFYDGGSFEIPLGSAAGRAGTIHAFTHEGWRLVFQLDDNGDGQPDSGAVPSDGDAIYVRTRVPGGDCPAGWSCSGDVALDPAEDAGGGTQATRLGTGGGSVSYYMDSYWRDGDQSAGKLRLVEGDVRLALNARGGGQVTVEFFRENQDAFCEGTFDLGAAWAPFEVSCTVPPGTDDPALPPQGDYRPILCVRVTTAGGDDVWIDDVVATMVDDDLPDLAFPRQLVDALELYRPGTLRMHAGQLGDDVPNLLADDAARAPSTYSPGDTYGSGWRYSVPQFLALCERVGADPWIVMPTSLMEADHALLMDSLTEPRDGGLPAWSEVFETIWLEWGNETWGGATQGDPFWGCSVNGGTREGALSSHAFARIRAHAGFDPGRFRLVAGGQAGWFGQNELIEDAGDQHDSLAIAPYYLGDPDPLGSDDDAFLEWARAEPYHAYEEDLWEFQDLASEHGHSLTVYELNFHSTGGGTSEEVRNRWVTSRAGGELLARQMLMNQRELQMPVQNAFALSQYSYHYGGGYVRLWGMVRDFTATERRRPTFLAVAMVNGVMGPEALVVGIADGGSWYQDDGFQVPSVEAWAFRWDDGCGVVVGNTHPDETREVTLQLPASCDGEWVCQRLSGDALADNEDAVAVEIQEIACAAGQPLDTPPGSLTTVRIGEEAPGDDDDAADDDAADDDSAGEDDADDDASDDDVGDDCSCSASPGLGRAAAAVALLAALGTAAVLRRRMG